MNPVQWTMTVNLADEPLTKSEPMTEKKLLTRRNFLRGAAIAGAGLAFYSGEIARHEISVLHRTIGLRDLPEAFEGYRVIQISDIHFDEYTEPSFVMRVVDRINALAPDLVLLTGDFISIGPLGHKFAEGAIHRCLTILQGLKAPAYACMGNHDTFLGAPMLKPIFRSYGIPMLMNDFLPIERNGQHFWLCGVGEYLSEVPDLNRTIPARPDGPVMLMCHCPDYVDQVLLHPRGPLVDFVLSGHTHGGQVRIPLLPPFHLPLGGQEYVEGLFRFGHLQLYVNRGIGTVGVPFRLNCPPEITVFRLERA